MHGELRNCTEFNCFYDFNITLPKIKTFNDSLVPTRLRNKTEV